MRVIKQARQMAQASRAIRRAGRTIGLVPTMGALHGGHASLIGAARRQTQVVVVSIFVNPLQFGPREDYARYPRNLTRDLAAAEAAGCDIVFAPHVSQLYPSGFCTAVEVTELSERLEGACRPGHFRGVATVVTKLFALVQPAVAYVGQKDFQQAVLVQRLVADLNLPVQIRLMPTVREPDGLAMSSRNILLTPEERRQAAVLPRALEAATARIRDGARTSQQVLGAMRRLIAREPSVQIEYLAAVNATTLKPLARLTGQVAVLAAIRVGSTRLIDNVLVDVS